MRPRLLFIYQKPTSFVRDDLRLLGERYDVRPFSFDLSGARTRPGRAALLARRWAEQAAWLRKELPKADLLFGWFADVHLSLPARAVARQGIPLAIAIGGFDAMDIPELGYGVFGTWRAPFARQVLHRASLLLPVAESLVQTTNSFLPASPEQGLRVHVPDLRTPIEVVPTGYDPAAWPLGRAERAPSVVSVALIDSDRTLRRKGVDLLIEVARRLPSIPFDVVGIEMDLEEIRQRYRPPANLALRPPLPREELAEVYGKAAVYLQLSRAEGMPNVLCEAMLCGCIPVGSRVFGIPAAIGQAGYLVEAPEPEAVARVVQDALDAPPSAREAAHAQIVEHFTRQKRRERLFQLLAGLMAEVA
ncbi:MAG: glycosyltransferase family 4 protein [Rhodothermaceae bacterium]|nr:glycosyltransferase family 4 protein [Rhodothermaceae bacterium]